jgi:probable HAF family extracellular repeat protein
VWLWVGGNTTELAVYCFASAGGNGPAKNRFSPKLRRGAVALLALSATALLLSVTTGSTAAATSPFVTVDLGTLGGADTYPQDVSDSGRVIGFTTTPAGAIQRAFTWTQDGGLVDLGTLAGGTTASAEAVNNAGQVVGWSTSTSGSRAFSWTEAGGMQDIGPGYGQALNEQGQVVAQSAARDDVGAAYLWTSTGGPKSLGTLGGDNSIPYDINENGQVVGESWTVPGVHSPSITTLHAFSWTAGGGMIDIGSLGGGYAIANAVNDSGQIVGYSTTATSSTLHAFSWTQAGGMRDLGPGIAWDVNNAGQVVGYTSSGASIHAFSWTAGGGLVDLGPGAAREVNDAGQVVGYTGSGASTHAFSWTASGGLVDLGTLGGASSNARAVNELGWVVGTSQTADGVKHAVIWKPVPLTPPGAPTSVTATAGDGQASVSFAAPASDGGAPITSYTVTASPGGTTSTAAGSPITVTGLTNGTSYTFTVVATNAVGTGPASTPSLAVTPASPPSGGGAGGGGGGGGGGDAPNTKVTVSVQSSPHNVGDTYAYSINLVNNGGSSNNTTLTVNLPSQTSYNGAVVDRGPGCTSAGTTVTCSLDFFPGGQTSTVIVGAKVNSLGTLVMTTSVTSNPSELNADGSVTTTLTLGGATAPTPSPAPAPTPLPPKSLPQSLATLTLFALKPTLLHTQKPSLHLSLKASKATELTLTLRDKKGHTLATWHRHAASGSDTYALLLPAGARKPGHDTLQIDETGNTTHKTLGVTVTA